MKAIYACKLYKASNRKAKIEAAIADPLNVELVTQLKSYLDEEYQEMIDRHEYKERAELAETFISDDDIEEEGGVENAPADSSSSSVPSGGFGGPSGGRPSLSEKFDMLISGDDNDDDSDDLSTDDSNDLDSISDGPELDDIEESTNINGVQDELVPSSDSPTLMIEDIKVLLNSDEATSGINRVLSKKNELWIYYNDDVNLNNVMGPVVEKLNTSGYDYMDFNRLARSENAVVFQINVSDDVIVNEEGIDGN